MQQTSLSAYESIAYSVLGHRQKVLLLCLMNDGPANNRVLSARTRLPINCVTPRVKELRESGFVREHSRRVDVVTGRSAIVWEACL